VSLSCYDSEAGFANCHGPDFAHQRPALNDLRNQSYSLHIAPEAELVNAQHRSYLCRFAVRIMGMYTVDKTRRIPIYSFIQSNLPLLGLTVWSIVGVTCRTRESGIADLGKCKDLTIPMNQVVTTMEMFHPLQGPGRHMDPRSH